MADQKQGKSRSRRKVFSRRNVLLGSLGVAATGMAGTSYYLGRTNVRLAPGHSRARAVLSSSTVPKTADVVLIGSSIVGTMTAYLLAERGVSSHRPHCTQRSTVPSSRRLRRRNEQGLIGGEGRIAAVLAVLILIRRKTRLVRSFRLQHTNLCSSFG
jgi:hypothetical protein